MGVELTEEKRKMSDDEVEKFHRDKLMLEKNDDDSDESSDTELNPSNQEMKLTHEEVQKYLDEEKRLREERMMSDEDDQNDDESDKIGQISVKMGHEVKSRRTSKMTAAQVEEMEQLALQEALERKQLQEKLVDEIDFEDPELMENEVDEKNDEKELENSEKVDGLEINSEAQKYLKIYKEIDEVESPALEKIISENLDAIKEAKTLIEFIDIKQTLFIDFKMAILF